MASSWQRVSFEHAPLEIIDGDRGAKYPKQRDFSVAGYCLFLNAGNVTSNGFEFTSCQFITNEKDKALGKGKLQRHDVVLTTRGTVGNVAYYDGNVPFENIRINSGMVILRPDPAKLLPRYLYLFLRSTEFRDQMQSLLSGSAQPQFPIRDIKKIEIYVPPLAEQRAIAHILGTLDDKIELNRRMNATLEAIARAIFKSWFVDFDPVHAKARGEQPAGMDAATAALFPDAFEDSELGPIPAGWGIGQLDDLLVLQRGFDLPTSKRVEGPYPVLAASGPSGFHNEFKVKGPGVTTGRSGVIGNVFLVHGDFWPLNTSLWVKEFRGAGPLYAYHLLQRLDLASYNAGSAVPTLNRNHIHSLPMPIPPVPLIRTFEEFVGSSFSMIKQNKQQSTTLAELRDALLPKLISGEIRVGGVENELA